jgi:hypothetical protein
MQIKSVSLVLRSLSALLIGLALVMVPAGVIYSASFLTLGALFPAGGFSQASNGLGAVAWRILCCLACAGVAGWLTQMLSKERVPFSLGVLSAVPTILTLMGINTSHLVGGLSANGQIIVSLVLGVVIFASGWIPKRAAQSAA